MEEKQQKRGGDGKEQTCFGGSDGGNNKKGEEIKEIGVKKKKICLVLEKASLASNSGRDH